MEGENRVNRLKIQRLKSRRKTRDIYKVVGCLMPYRLCALTSAQLKLSSVRFMQHKLQLCDLHSIWDLAHGSVIYTLKSGIYSINPSVMWFSQ